MPAIRRSDKGGGGIRLAPLLILICGVFAATASATTALPDSVAAELRRYKVPIEDLSIYVAPLSGGKPMLALNTRVPRAPASVIKLLTALVALERLGPGYTWRTEAFLDGELQDGVLEGDLILKGYGDPYLTPESFWRFLRGLRERGIHRIHGDVVLDESYFQVEPQGRGDFDGKPRRAYNALPSALSLNFQTTQLIMFPDRSAGRVRVFAYPPLANLDIVNGLKLVNAPCRWRNHQPRFDISENGAGALIKVGGRYSAACPETSVARLVMTPSTHVGGAFKSIWRELGGRVEGRFRVGSAQDDMAPFHTLESRSLGEVIRGMNKYSNNLMSRLLLLTLGAEYDGEPGTVAKGRAAVAAWLHEHGLAFPELVLDNGSGLSRRTRISARNMARLLLAGYQSPYMPEFMASLAVAGVDGTMRSRFKGKALAGRAHIKTGSLNHVSDMSGYVLDREGRRWAVVMFINHRGIQSWEGKQVQDALLQWIYEGGHSPAPPDMRMAVGPEPGCDTAAATPAAEASAQVLRPTGAAQIAAMPQG
jgi:D-alanyl-D-alanine carboxypeptidase/D-alanyl-D-alanine-endopeptidase (penicillin-binding protein 4)